MAKPDLGTKRICAGCGTKFYDLNKSPIICPRCETVFTEQVKPAKAASTAAPEEEKLAAGGAELVSLEDAEKEQTKAKAGKPSGDGDEDDFDSDDETLGDDGDDPFLSDEEEDEEDSDDVSGLIGGSIEPDDEDS